ncbi:MAG: hypothetical protein JRH11_12405 [Deltaproteobacteria bacterium]|nr:hypothetical protein [Deltaproteobacteria bacterium]
MGDGEAKRGNLWTWIGVGCGGLLFLGVAGSCVGPAIVGILMTEGLGGLGGGLPSVAPLGGPGGGGGHPGLELPDAPGPIEAVGSAQETKVATARFEVVVTDVGFIPGVEVGAVCPLEVNHLQRSPNLFWCQTEFECSGQRLYGGSGQGFFECTWPSSADGLVDGWDPEQTAVDGDPSFFIGTNGTITIQDGQLRFEGTIRRVMHEGGDALLPAPGTAAP